MNVRLKVVIKNNQFDHRFPHRSKVLILQVFSVKPFKVDLNKNQNHSTDKVQNGEMKGGKYTKTLAKI